MTLWSHLMVDDRPATRPSLIVRLRDNKDQQAWHQFVAIYAPVVYGYAIVDGMQDTDTADVLQLVLIQVSRSVRSFDYDPKRGRFRNWIRTITHHQMAKVHKDNRKQPRPAEISDDRESGSAWDELFDQNVLRQALERLQHRLPAQDWRAFELLWNKVPFAEVATQIDRPIGWVYKAKHRASCILREELDLLANDSIIHL